MKKRNMDGGYTGKFRRLGLEVSKSRKEKGLTQEELAVKVGVSRSLIANLEGGHCSISLYSLHRICMYLEIKVVVPLR